MKNKIISIATVVLMAAGALVGVTGVSAYTGGGNNATGIPTNCSALNAYQYLCNGGKMGGKSWHFYRVCKSGEEGSKESDGRPRCDGPTTPRGTNVLESTTIDIAYISTQCKKEGADWYVAFGWEGMNKWNRPDGQRWDGTPGSIQIGPVNYNIGWIIDGAAYNNYLATSSSVALVAEGMKNNTKITQGLAEELYCNNELKKNGTPISQCNFNRNMTGKAFFCYGGKQSLTVKYQGEEINPCWRTSSGMKQISPDQVVEDNGNGDLEPAENSIRVQTRIQELIDQGWTFEGSDTPQAVPYPPGYMGNTSDYTLDLNTRTYGSKVATLRFSKGKDESCTPEVLGQCGEWTPQSYSSSDAYHGYSSVVSAVKNQSLEGVNQNGEWHGSGNAENGPALKENQNEITYAKPSDNILWYHCYYPGAHTTATNWGSVNKYHASHTEGAASVDSSITNKLLKEHSWWPTNNFWVTSELLDPSFSYNSPTYQKEDYDANGKEKQHTYNVAPKNLDAGDTLREDSHTVEPTDIATTNEGVHSWGCHRDSHTYYDADGNPHTYTHLHDTCQHDKDFWRYDIGSNGHTNDHAIAKVPYNFLNQVSVTVNSPDPIYEGETLNIDASVSVGTRQNDETNGDYATEVEGVGQAKIIAFLAEPVWRGGARLVGVTKQDNYGNSISDGWIWNSDSTDICAVTNAKYGMCRELESTGGTLNPEGKMEGVEALSARGSYNIFDEAAGNQFCVAAAVYPYTVKNTGAEKDKDMDKRGDHAWLMSEPICRTIAKKPNFQVWGAGVYSSGNVDTKITTKNNIKNFVGWGPKGGQNTIFSSWGELLLTVAGQTSTMASGASTGHTGGTAGVSDPGTSRQVSDMGKPGGMNTGTDFCLRSPLSLANVMQGGSNSVTALCQSSVGMFDNDSVMSGTMQSDMLALTEMLAEYPNVNKRSATTIPGDTLESGTRINIVDNGDITISGDITYGTWNNRNAQYTSPQDIPKYIIYAKNGNINIDCNNVKRIDAVLITDDQHAIDTCYNGGDVNSAERSNQLVITGALVTGTVRLNRTYGTGIGAYSIVPAELVNYDSSLYLWANAQSEGATSGQMSETAIRELAPRY